MLNPNEDSSFTLEENTSCLNTKKDEERITEEDPLCLDTSHEDESLTKVQNKIIVTLKSLENAYGRSSVQPSSGGEFLMRKFVEEGFDEDEYNSKATSGGPCPEVRIPIPFTNEAVS